MADVSRGEFDKLFTIVNGNGVDGHAQKIARLEKESKDSTCPTGKALSEYLEELKDRRRFRGGDIANMISAVGLIIVLIKLFILGV